MNSASDRGQHAGSNQARGHRMLANPPPDLFDRSARASFDWSSVKKTLQVIGQLAGGLIAMSRFLSQTLEANRLEIPRDIRLQLGHGDRLVVQNLQNRIERRFALKRRSAGQQLIENGAQRVDIGGRTDRRAVWRCLFGAM